MAETMASSTSVGRGGALRHQAHTPPGQDHAADHPADQGEAVPDPGLNLRLQVGAYKLGNRRQPGERVQPRGRRPNVRQAIEDTNQLGLPRLGLQETFLVPAKEAS